MTIAEVMDKFNYLEKLCPQMITFEEDKIRRIKGDVYTKCTSSGIIRF